ncbi:TPA: bifunctional (p)ppGpp synthetase/guanosine-3',5'-bis(diphosphate) 3'-pyrophosphohydrolase [Pseudomonas aeruginosa]|uniref:HD domain-containing protein n=1 Tax=Pseudomonas aeruginosa TaxID=287 RepID=UPI000D390E3F|nr:HD domain-containing protein [Pseudomonas aeruginosa]ELK4923047.1 bifunctional (p)ppGpp synthetase/guanosine-3',5'-bis(diphosphate) 3'-pyrophosphohydrolase [Pseudomonas aeruginosa]MBI8772116.1 bifunctional (p)ppGpp synthetase/guanosine-3',5'-bis(diphosphate) 3'-pyrophosphohydrolase [Pseudomonas aeruginosa]MCO2722796.1 bifunctional (p)ppGpp synthetase/guanosine-3',5'-bis(diphosphate) 3'-pyrophosphohydrolase [Pseudomonas aeruginosa]MCO2730544.1 bifunctional (p)ppGpp synthetase/guanosine-3',5'-
MSAPTMSTHLADHYNQAWLFAARAHRNQTLSGSPLPYLVHLGMVANALLAADRDGAIERLGETLQIAVLHDTLEDTATSPEELRQQFGEFVCAGVQALSKRVGDGPKRSLDDYLQALAEGPAQYALVKLCDRITNLQPPPQTWNQDKIANYHQESQLILARLGHAHAATARRLREKIEHYRQYY